MTTLHPTPPQCIAGGTDLSVTEAFVTEPCPLAVHFFGDKEGVTFSINDDGFPSFAKDAAYEGEGKLGLLDTPLPISEPEYAYLPVAAPVPSLPQTEPASQQANVFFGQPFFVSDFGSHSSTTLIVRELIERETIVLPHSDVPAVPLPGAMGLLPAALLALAVVRWRA